MKPTPVAFSLRVAASGRPPQTAALAGRPSLHRAARAVLAALLLAGLPAAALAVQDCELDGEHVNPANGHTTAGKSGIVRCRDRATGELLRERQLQSGAFVGLVRIYEHGKLTKEHSLNARGNMEGRAREFAPDGRILREATYDNGRETGLVRSFHPNGQLRRAAFYAEPSERASAEFTEAGQLSALRCGDKPLLAPLVDDARLCGFGGKPSRVELFDGKGTLRSRLSYVGGKRVRGEDFYDNGKPAAQVEIADNRRTERRFSSEGVKRREVVFRLTERGAVRQSEQAFSEQGLLVRDQRWDAAGLPLLDESYYLNGQPRRKAVYSGDGEMRTVEVTEYHDNGRRAALGPFLSAGHARLIPIGTHQRFGENGVLRAESTYDDKGRITRERVFDEKGRLERDDAVFEDGSRKAYAR